MTKNTCLRAIESLTDQEVIYKIGYDVCLADQLIRPFHRKRDGIVYEIDPVKVESTLKIMGDEERIDYYIRVLRRNALPDQIKSLMVAYNGLRRRLEMPLYSLPE